MSKQKKSTIEVQGSPITILRTLSMLNDHWDGTEKQSRAEARRRRE